MQRSDYQSSNSSLAGLDLFKNDSRFCWSQVQGHLNYGLVPVKGKWRVFTPDGELIVHELDSLEQARQWADMDYSRRVLYSLIGQWSEEGLITPQQHDLLTDRLYKLTSFQG